LKRVLGLAALAACYEPALETCTVVCGGNDPCPSGLTCGADFHCHAPGDETTCTFSVELELAGDQALLQGTTLKGVDTPLSCPGNCKVDLAGGTELVLESVLGPMSNALFTFEGACTEHTCRFSSLDRDVVVTATVSTGKRINVSLIGDGQGTIVSDPEGLDCPGRCAAVFAPEQLVKLTATETIPSKFRGWTAGECSDDPTCELPPASNDLTVPVDASFDVNKLVLTPFGENTVGDTIEVFANNELEPREVCEAPCQITFDPNVRTPIRLEAVPVDEDSHKFQQWIGLSGCTTNRQCSFDLDSETDRVGIAVFERRPLIRVDYGPEGSGSLTITPSQPDACKPAVIGAAATTTCRFHVDLGTTLSLKAAPVPGLVTQWTDCPTILDPNTCEFPVTTEEHVIAFFAAMPALN
jgi:hypothetical protein